jgi:hypothetical protein
LKKKKKKIPLFALLHSTISFVSIGRKERKKREKIQGYEKEEGVVTKSKIWRRHKRDWHLACLGGLRGIRLETLYEGHATFKSTKTSSLRFQHPVG